MKTLSTAAAAALSRSPLPIAALVEMDLSSPLFLNTGGIDLVIASSTYYGTKGLGKIEPVMDSPAEVKPVRFELACAGPEMVALALAEPVQGKAVRIKLAIFDPDTYEVLDVRLRWAGKIDLFQVTDGADGKCLLSCTAEHAGIHLTRPTARYFSDSEQRRISAIDAAFQYQVDQLDRRILWPDRSYGRV